MTSSNETIERVAQRVKETLEQGHAAQKRPINPGMVRSAAFLAMKGTRLMGLGAGNLAREAVEGAVQAVGEVSGETRAFVKDAVIGVLEGTEQVVTITTPVVREAVVGAVRGSRKAGGEAGEAGRNAVEGAIVGTAALGMDQVHGANAAVEGALAAVQEAGGELEDAAKAAVGGVVSGMAATGGDVAAATRETVHQVVAQGAAAPGKVEDIGSLAEDMIEAAIAEAESSLVGTSEVAAAAAAGAFTAAHQAGHAHGENVQRSIVRYIRTARQDLAPEVERTLSELSARLSTELPRGRASWRGRTLFQALRLLFRSGGIDLAGSLAYFTILSFFPLIALMIMGLSALGDSEAIRGRLTETLMYVFPASEELLQQAVDSLLNGSLTVSLVVFIGLLLGANGLFMSVDRAVNRIFQLDTRRMAAASLGHIGIATLVVMLLMLSVGVTAAFQAVVTFGGKILGTEEGVSTALIVTLGIVSTLFPPAMIAVVFTFVYRYLPNRRVEWRDAAFGSLTAVILFELGKHLFFWFVGISSQRNAIYGPVASVVVLMMWAYMAGFIFLYGASLTRVAEELRPRREDRSSIETGPMTEEPAER